MTQSNAKPRHLELVGGKAAAKLPQYMFKRGDNFYFKRKIPADAAEAFPASKGQVWKSLETNLLTKAKVRLAVETTEFNLTLAAFRRKKAATQADDDPRSGSRSRLSVVKAVGELALSASAHIQPSPAPATVQVPAASATPRSKMQERIDQVRSLEASLERLRSLTPGAGTSSASRRSITAPVPVRQDPSGSKQTILHLFEDWKRTQTRSRTVTSVETAVLEFRGQHGSIPVDTVTRPMARSYRDQLIERGLSRGTIENRLGFLSTLVRHGMKELVEHMVGNPFERIEIVGATGRRPPKDRRAYEVFELNKIFASRLYTQRYRPKGQAHEAAYWLPLMGPFIGARIEELCQLSIKDVQRINGVWCIRICNLDDDQKVKTDGSFRRVPLHTELIQCGFLAFVAKVAATGATRVFSALTNANQNEIFSNSPGKWYGRYLTSIGLSDPRLDYHSYRYSFKQQCSLCDVDLEVRDALTGHWVGSRDSGRTYMKSETKQYPFGKLVKAMHLLRYDELRISHLYVENPMAEVERALLK